MATRSLPGKDKIVLIFGAGDDEYNIEIWDSFFKEDIKKGDFKEFQGAKWVGISDSIKLQRGDADDIENFCLESKFCEFNDVRTFDLLLGAKIKFDMILFDYSSAKFIKWNDEILEKIKNLMKPEAIFLLVQEGMGVIYVTVNDIIAVESPNQQLSLVYKQLLLDLQNMKLDNIEEDIYQIWSKYCENFEKSNQNYLMLGTSSNEVNLRYIIQKFYSEEVTNKIVDKLNDIYEQKKKEHNLDILHRVFPPDDYIVEDREGRGIDGTYPYPISDKHGRQNETHSFYYIKRKSAGGQRSPIMPPAQVSLKLESLSLPVRGGEYDLKQDKLVDGKKVKIYYYTNFSLLTEDFLRGIENNGKNFFVFDERTVISSLEDLWREEVLPSPDKKEAELGKVKIFTPGAEELLDAAGGTKEGTNYMIILTSPSESKTRAKKFEPEAKRTEKFLNEKGIYHVHVYSRKISSKKIISEEEYLTEFFKINPWLEETFDRFHYITSNENINYKSIAEYFKGGKEINIYQGDVNGVFKHNFERQLTI